MSRSSKKREQAAAAAISSVRKVRQTTRGKPRPRRFAWNLRLLAWTAAVLTVGGTSVFGWHAYQVDRSVAALLKRADEQEKAKQWHDAAESLYRYLRLRPTDAEARARMAKDFDGGASSRAEKMRAIELYAVAIGQIPEDADLLRRQMLLLLDTGDYTQALIRAGELLKRQPNDADGLRGRALGLLARWRLKGEGSAEALVKAFDQAISKRPSDALLASELARIYHSQPIKGLNEAQRREKADEVMQRLIDSNPNSTEAFLARYTFRNEFGIEGADDDLVRALEADAERTNIAVRLTSGARAMQKREFTAASQFFEQVIQINPRDPRGYLGLGMSREEAGDKSGALKAWQSGLQRADGHDFALQLRTASCQVRIGQFAEAQETLDKLERQIERLLGPQKNEWRADIQAVRAEAATSQQDYRTAITCLNDVLRLRRGNFQSPQMAAIQALVEQQLGGCYMALRQWDEAASAYQRAATLQPGRAAIRFAAARAWEGAGRLDEAIRQYEDGLTFEQAAAPLVALAHARFRQQLVLPKNKRDWREFSDVLAKAQATAPDGTSLKMLRAEFEVEQDRTESAIDVLRDLEADAVRNAELARRLIFAYERCKRPEDADRVLALLEREHASLETLLLHANLLSTRGELAEASALLQKKMGVLSPADRRLASYRLALIDVASGDRPAAITLLKELIMADRNNLESLELLAELSLDAGDLDQVGDCAEAIRRIEGIDGAEWRFYEAQRLLRKSAIAATKPVARKLLDEAQSLSNDISRRRPNWSLAHVLKARLSQSPLHPDYDVAVNAYFQAIRLGENRLRIYEELVLLLYQQHRLVEAAAYLERLSAAGNLSSTLNTMAMVIDAEQGNLTRAIDSARADVERRPDDAMAHLRLGQLLAQVRRADAKPLTEDLAAAEASLRRASELAQEDARPWLALLTFLGQTKQNEAARTLLREIEQGDNLPSKSKPFVLAQGYVFIGERALADAFFRKAVEAVPDGLAVQVQAARFFFESDEALAERCLIRARQLAPDNSDVKQLLATLQAMQSTSEEELDDALALLDEDGSDGPANPADQRLKALLLLRRGGTAARQRALRLLEALASDHSKSAPIDRVLLARLYEARGRSGMTAARQQLEALINREKPRPDHLAIYVDHLLRNKQADQAGGALDQLTDLEPETNHLRSLALRARWLHAVGRQSEIEPLVAAYQQASLSKLSPPEQAVSWREIASLYSLVELFQAAESSYRQSLGIDPSSYVPYAMWLVGRGRTSEAVQLCSEAANADAGSRPAMTLCTVLALGDVSGEERKSAEALIEKTLEDHAGDPRLLFSAATMRLMEGKSDDAIALLQQVIEISPNNLQAMNNLAMLLAEKPGRRKEALAYVDRAISLKGLDPELLDTKGWILLRQNEPKQAEALFLEAVAAPPGDPHHQLHLALAYQAQGKAKEARQTLAHARENRLGLARLSPIEQTALAELEAALK